MLQLLEPPTSSSLVAHRASFRDPGGFVYVDDQGELLRQVNSPSAEDYVRLMESGLYDELVGNGLLIEHEEISLDRAATGDATHVLKPRRLALTSYPYEWAFSALKDAALLTLEIQERALAHGMSLKDASAYNVQFDGTSPIFIDTLSLETNSPGQPWVAYGQFCRHFLAPLALMAKRDISLGQMLRQHLDGIPLDLAAKLLPWRSRLHPGLLMHLHLHAKSVTKHAATDSTTKAQPRTNLQMSTSAVVNLVDSLRRTISGLDWNPAGTEWADYYSEHSYSDEGFRKKRSLVRQFIEQIGPATAWDLGANTGVFSRLAAEAGAQTLALDIDPACVQRNYLACRSDQVPRVLPLQIDLTNPSPALGWAHAERDSLAERGPVDLVLALALVHHLAISNNVPLPRVAAFLHQLGRHVVIEFVPKGDPQVQRLLCSRKDIFADYDQTNFERSMTTFFDIQDQQSVGSDGRVIYWLQSREVD